MSKVKYAVVSGAPILNVRNAPSRNQRRLSKRLARLERVHGELFQVSSDTGRLKVYVKDNVLYTGTVKRDTQREARKLGGVFVQL